VEHEDTNDGNGIVVCDEVRFGTWISRFRRNLLFPSSGWEAFKPQLTNSTKHQVTRHKMTRVYNEIAAELNITVRK